MNGRLSVTCVGGMLKKNMDTSYLRQTFQEQTRLLSSDFSAKRKNGGCFHFSSEEGPWSEGSHHSLFAQDPALSFGLNSQMPLISQQFTMITL